MAEKEQAQAVLEADSSRTRTLQQLQGSRKEETRQQRLRRHMLYLNQLLASKNEQMKRKLLDLVDGVHKEEREALDGDLDKCRGEMRRWEKKCQEPVNFDVFVINRLTQIEKEEQHERRRQEQMASCDTTEASRCRLLELSDICEQYGMEDFVKEKMTMSDHQLVKQFASGIDKPFLAYKQNASIDRALLKCNLKERTLTKAEQKVLDVVAYERESARLRKLRRGKHHLSQSSDASLDRMQNKLYLSPND